MGKDPDGEIIESCERIHGRDNVHVRMDYFGNRIAHIRNPLKDEWEPGFPPRFNNQWTIRINFNADV